MSTAELNQAKLNLIAWINQLSDVDILSFLDGLRRSKTKNDWWDELNDAQKKSITDGLKDAEKGKLLSSTDFWDKLKNA